MCTEAQSSASVCRSQNIAMTRFNRIVALLTLVLTTGVFAADGDSPLIEAVKRGDHNAVRTLIRGKANVNAAGVDGTTALHYAVQSDDIELVRMLLQAGANAKATNRYGLPPITLAATNGSAKVIEALLAAGADPNTTT